MWAPWILLSATCGGLCALWRSVWCACGAAFFNLLLIFLAQGVGRRSPPKPNAEEQALHVAAVMGKAKRAESPHLPVLRGQKVPTPSDGAARSDVHKAEALASALRAQRYRFLVAAKWDVQLAARNLQATLRWRREQGVDAYRQDAVGPFGPVVSRSCQSFARSSVNLGSSATSRCAIPQDSGN